MNILKWLFDKKHEQNNPEQKEYFEWEEMPSSYLYTGQSSNIHMDIKPRTAYELSERNSDLGSTVNKISSSISSLRIGLAEIDSDDSIDYNHEVIKILTNPKGGLTGRQMWREMAESFLLTQEAWLVARGNVDRPALELVFIRPYDVNIVKDHSTGEPITITTTSCKDRRTYERTIYKGNVRYFDRLKLNELIPVIGSISITDEWRGRSLLNKISYDLSMSTDGKRHNTSLLKNGMRTTGIISPKSTGNADNSWTRPMVETLQKDIRAFNQGAGSAGNVLITSKPAEVQGLAQTNKDMDYTTLLTKSQEAIYNLFSIPLALVFGNAMTYDNLVTANRTYYTKSVFPFFNQIADLLLNKLRPRYDIKENQILRYSIKDIEDLQPVIVENMKKLKEAEVASTNEIRAIGGFSENEYGYDILVTANKVPLQTISSSLNFGGVENESSQDSDQQQNEIRIETDKQTDTLGE